MKEEKRIEHSFQTCSSYRSSWNRRLTEADLFSTIVWIEHVIDDIDRVPGILIVSSYGIDWHSAFEDAVAVEEGRAKARRAR